jgi:Anti-sigma-K factor rskA
MTKTPPPSQPEPWSELLAGYVLGDLNPAEIEIVEQYLTEHPEEQSEVNDLILSLDILPLTLPLDFPPASLKQRIMQMAESEPVADIHPVIPRKIESQSANLWRTVIGGLGLLILGGLGWQNYQLSQELATVRQDLTNTKIAHDRQEDLNSQTYRSVVGLLQEPNNRFLPLKSSSKKSMGMGSLVMAPQKSSAFLTLQKVPPIPKTQVYRVWAIMGDNEMACADFLPDADGKVSIQIPFKSWQETTKVMITIEEKTAIEPKGEIAIES